MFAKSIKNTPSWRYWKVTPSRYNILIYLTIGRIRSYFKKMKSTVIACAAAIVVASADMRSTVYEAIVARSGARSDCNKFSSLFSSNATYQSPVGGNIATGQPLILEACEQWNSILGKDGNGWYPGDLWNAPGRTAFTLRIVRGQSLLSLWSVHSFLSWGYEHSVPHPREGVRWMLKGSSKWITMSTLV